MRIKVLVGCIGSVFNPNGIVITSYDIARPMQPRKPRKDRQESKMKIRRLAEECYACKMCQIVCSFHHTGSFWPEKSSICVYRKPQEGVIIWKLDASCNGCAGEAGPLCVKYCQYGALRVEA